MGTEERVYLGIDLGAESGRVVAGHWNGKSCRLEELYRFPNGPVRLAGSLRWNITGLWSGILKGLSIAQQKFGDTIRSVGVDSWGVDYVLLNQDMELLGQPYCYRDPRTEGIAERLFDRVSREIVFEKSGTQFMEINSLFQLFAMAEQEPESMKQAAHFMMIGDYINWLLTGRISAEYTNATTTQFLDPRTHEWSKDLLGDLGIPGAMLPEIVHPGTLLGQTGEDVKIETGIDALSVVVPATHDTGSAVVAVPSIHTGKANWAYISSGTWSLMGVELPEATLGAKVLECNMTNEGGVDGTSRLLKNIMGLWVVQECRHDFQRKGNVFEYATLVELASEAEPFRSLIPVNDTRFLRPASMTEMIAETCRETGQPVPDTEGQFIRCCLESLAFAYRETLEEIQNITSEKIEVIHIVGGGCKNALLNQFTANACGVPVLAGPVEATVIGNLLIQVRADGELNTLAEIRSAAAACGDMTEFEPRDTATWKKQNQRWLKLRDE
ncbi:rhamnulokinase [Verrucomicrobia bacterium]|nr:rhamnulokinase [Verrucomicrobiota bacterium]